MLFLGILVMLGLLLCSFYGSLLLLGLNCLFGSLLSSLSLCISLLLLLLGGSFVDLVLLSDLGGLLLFGSHSSFSSHSCGVHLGFFLLFSYSVGLPLRGFSSLLLFGSGILSGFLTSSFLGCFILGFSLILLLLHGRNCLLLLLAGQFGGLALGLLGSLLLLGSIISLFLCPGSSFTIALLLGSSSFSKLLLF